MARSPPPFLPPATSTNFKRRGLLLSRPDYGRFGSVDRSGTSRSQSSGNPAAPLQMSGSRWQPTPLGTAPVHTHWRGERTRTAKEPGSKLAPEPLWSPETAPHTTKDARQGQPAPAWRSAGPPVKSSTAKEPGSKLAPEPLVSPETATQTTKDARQGQPAPVWRSAGPPAKSITGSSRDDNSSYRTAKMPWPPSKGAC